MNVTQEKYEVFYAPEKSTIFCKGALRLNEQAEDFQSISQLLNSVIDEEPCSLTLDLKELVFLNSLGINLLSKFVINARKKKIIQITVLGSKGLPWQEKSLKNLQRLMPNLDLKID
jgi:hypothetical protein